MSNQNTSNTQRCRRCVMDSSDPDITFDDGGICSHCIDTSSLYQRLPTSEDDAYQRLEKIAEKIRAEGEGQEFDSVIGLSGGVDSSYVAYLAKKLRLRPLAVHFDNGWNSEIAVANIKNIVTSCDMELMTYVINWPEFRDLQRAFLKASVVDIELLTDHAITAAMFKIAKQQKIKYVLSGSNIATESGMPKSWIWRKQDWRNIKAIHRRYGEGPLNNFPSLGVWKWIALNIFPGMEFVPILDSTVYKKLSAMETLKQELNWRDYGGKHYESVFTKFYQAHVLPQKFGIDKRLPHLSSLIRNGEVTRDEALEALSEPLYSATDLANEKQYVLKKLGFSDSEWEGIMSQPPRSHADFPSDEWVYRTVRKLKGLLNAK